MPKAGPAPESVSKRVRPARIHKGNNYHADAVQVPSDAQSHQPHPGIGHNHHSDDIVIGLALGSPRQSPVLAASPDDRGSGTACVCSSSEAGTLGNVSEIGGGTKGFKRKGSKWRSLGNFFGRSQIRSTSPIHQLGQKQQMEPAKQLMTSDELETNALRRKWADSNHGSKAHKVNLSTGMSGSESSGLLRRTSSRRRGLRRRRVEEPQPEMQQIPAEYTTHAIADNSDPHREQQASRMLGSLLLEVEIPCVELERYSVMFGDVLRPQAWQSKPQPSLLARRQAHLEELHTVADSNSKPFDFALPKPVLQGDSISFDCSKSPSFSLFPSTPPHSACNPVNKFLLRPSPLNRPSAEPSHGLFPPKTAIRKSISQDQGHFLVIEHNSEDNSQTPTSCGRQPCADPSQRSANLAKGSCFKCSEHPEYSYQATETDTPPPTKGATQDPPQSAFPARKSSMRKRILQEPRDKHQGENSIGSTAEVSVARQISISRRQRQLLVPIAPKTARQPIQPEVNKESSTIESRKSHHLTLEDV